MIRNMFIALTAAGLVCAAYEAPVLAKEAPATWDNLVRVKSKRLEAVYLLPGADFRPYHKVMLAPTEVAFRKNWMKDVNNSTINRMARIDQAEAERIAKKARTGFETIFAKAYTDAGYSVVTQPGPDVVNISTAVINLYIDSPDALNNVAGRSRTYSVEAGQAALVIEARDSTTGAVLGRAVDRQIAGDDRPGRRTEVSNTADFGDMFRHWAKVSVDGFSQLKALSPISGTQTAGR